MTTSATAQPAYASTNPATGEVTARFDYATDDTVESAMSVGVSAFQSWRERPIKERAALAKKVGDLFAERADELAQIAAEEMGKPHGEAVEEVEFCQSIFGYYADHGPDLAADQPIKSFEGDQAVVQKRPVGLLLGVMPWNFPYYQVARFAAPNMVLGNTVLLKHAESVRGAPRRSSGSSTTPVSRRGSTRTCSRPSSRSRRSSATRGCRASRSPAPSGPGPGSPSWPAATSRSACSSSAGPTRTSSSTPTTSRRRRSRRGSSGSTTPGRPATPTSG